MDKYEVMKKTISDHATEMGNMWEQTRILGAIIFELGDAIKNLGGKSDILSITCSFRNTLSDEEVLAMLKEWNEEEHAS